VAAVTGFPLALVFGWIYDVGPNGIRRTPPATADELAEPMPLRSSDYVVLALFLAVLGAIVYGAAARILIDAPHDATTVDRSARAPENSIAVLPFTNLSGDAEKSYFTDGVSDEILNRLADYDDLYVVARTSSFAFRDSGYDVRRITTLLGVRYLLQGSVRQDGDQLRISAQLVDADGRQIWSTAFDRRFERIFEVQRNVADAVAAAIVPQIDPPRPGSGTYEPDLEAYRAFLVGRSMIEDRPTGYRIEAPRYLRRAIELDPNFAEAHAELAIALTLSAGVQPGRTRASVLDEVGQLIERAFELEPVSARAHAALGLSLLSDDALESEAALRRAIAGDPTTTGPYNWLASALSRQGRHEEARRMLERALAVDPLAPVVGTNLAFSYLAAGDRSAADELFRRLLQVPAPGADLEEGFLSFLLETGQLTEAVEVARARCLRYVAATGAYVCHDLAEAYARLGIDDRARFWIERPMPQIPNVMVTAARFLDRTWRRLGLHAEAYERWQAVLAAADQRPSQLRLDYRTLMAMRAAFSGETGRGRALVEEALAVLDGGPRPSFIDAQIEALQLLAWIDSSRGEASRAEDALAAVERFLADEAAGGRLGAPARLYLYAQNAAVAGDPDTALARLGEAIRSGWRDPFLLRHDPRWDGVRAHPGFDALMEPVLGDVERMREEVVSAGPEAGFVERVEAARREAIRTGRALPGAPP
jgi:TolB-like protein/Flp pilus assembly protein TadD